MVKAIIFDLDDTLFDCTGQLVHQARKRAGEVMVQESIAEDFDEAYKLQADYSFKHPGDEIFDFICEGYEKSIIDRIKNAFNEISTDIKPYPEANKVLNELKVKGFKLFLVSYGKYSRQNKKIDILGLRDYFDKIIINDPSDNKNKKDVFLNLKNDFSLDSKNTFVVGDRLNSEIYWGNFLGMKTIRILKGKLKDVNENNYFEKADYNINDLKELLYIDFDKKKVVVIGGGTGQYALLRGLKKYDMDITAIVTTMDNGGSSGKLRTDFGILPPGDLRNCLLALSKEKKLKDLVQLFKYRFSEGKNFKDHNLGNLIITALCDIEGNMGKAIKKASEILEIKGKVLPVSIDDSHLYGMTEKGDYLKGESEVSYPALGDKIKSIWLDPPAKAYDESVYEIIKSDYVIICPGDLYGSIMPNLLVDGITDAINGSGSKVLYVCNLVTKRGSYGFKASNFVKEIEKHSGISMDLVICNCNKPSKNLVDKYKEEDSLFVEDDVDDAIKADLLEEYRSGDKYIARHDSKKLAEIIFDIISGSVR
ncbi:MAG: uridine diphosphate-N-acetylglucosamine-binding protein YvcK [Nanobdellota archaeon]